MSAGRSPATLALAAGLSVALAVVVGGFAVHPAFVPATLLRTIAPILALLAGAAFTHAVARVRERVDVPGEFDPAGRALFLGLVMLVVTVTAWLALAQGLPAFWTAGVGTPRLEAGLVVRKPDAGGDAGCTWRLEVSSASVARPLEQCVSQAVWRRAEAGGSVPLRIVASRLGAEIVEVGDAVAGTP